MDYMARMTSKGQLTVPKPVRDALGLRAGDNVHLRLEKDRAVVARIPNLLESAGSIPVPPEKRNTPWEEVIAEGRRAMARRSL